MELLEKISSPSNSRLGVEEYLKLFLNHVCAYYDAKLCFLIVASMDRKSHTVYRSHQTLSPENDQAVASDIAQMLMSLPARSAISYYARRGPMKFCQFQTYELEEKDESVALKLGGQLAAWIGMESFLSVPLV